MPESVLCLLALFEGSDHAYAASAEYAIGSVIGGAVFCKNQF
jgi:hypothetical protein